jgi:leucyl/phenylalanyl-tRNA---protein transferase
MFSQVRDSSKVALAFLVEHLRQREFCLLDTQFMTDHLRRLGAVEITAVAYKQRLSQALLAHTSFS